MMLVFAVVGIVLAVLVLVVVVTIAVGSAECDAESAERARVWADMEARREREEVSR